MEEEEAAEVEVEGGRNCEGKGWKDPCLAVVISHGSLMKGTVGREQRTS